MTFCLVFPNMLEMFFLRGAGNEQINIGRDKTKSMKNVYRDTLEGE